VACSLGAAPAARAQSTSDKAAAEGLFDQGRASMQQRDFAKACGLLERSQQIDPAVGTLLYLAECYEKGGRTASAWATFREAADAADAAKSPVRARTARDRAARLEPLLSRLTITVDPENLERPGLIVERRGQPVTSAVFNVPVPVDPGTYPIVADAPGFERWTDSVTVPERAGSATINVPPLNRSLDSKPPIAAPAGTAGGVELEKTTQAAAVQPAGLAPEPRPGGTQRALAYVTGGIGLVGVGVGSYFGVRAITKSKAVEDHAATGCAADYSCSDPTVADDQDAARSAARASNIAFAIGGVALLGATVLYLTLPSRNPQSGSWGARLSASGVLVEGSFQ